MEIQQPDSHYVSKEQYRFIVLFILMLSYGLITLSPSILFGKIVIRELIAVAVFSWFDYPKEEIMLTAFFTWGFNVVLPVLFALIRISSTWKARFFS